MYKLHFPSSHLSPYIENYWSLSRSPGEDLRVHVQVYVDARADLVFNMGTPYTRQRHGSKPALYGHSNLDAQRDYPIAIAQQGDVRIVGVRFRTGGLAPFVGFPLARISNLTPSIAEVFGSGISELERQLKNGDDPKPLLDGYFEALFQTRPAMDTFIELKTSIEDTAGTNSVDRLGRQAGLSTRSLERLFSNYLGFSPKLFARISRFQKALKLLMRDKTASLAQVAADCGYYDQSHFVKDFRRFTGEPPRGYKGYYPESGPSDFAPNVVEFLQDEKSAVP